MGIEYSGNSARKGFSHKEQRKTIEEYLQSNIANSKKRIRLIEEGLKKISVKYVVEVSGWASLFL